MAQLYLLFELDEHTMCARRMDERHQRAVRAGARLLVDQAHAVRLEPSQRGGDVVDAQGNVVRARSAPSKIFHNRRIVARRLEELEGGSAGWNEVRPHPL